MSTPVPETVPPPESVTLAGVRHAVEVPTRFAVRKSLGIAYGRNALIGAAAMVAESCPTLRLGIRSLQRRGFDASDYGADAWEALAARGATDEEISAAGSALLVPVIGDLFRIKASQEVVKEARDFSSGPEGASS